MSLWVFYYCTCAFLCHCRSFNPSLCRLSSFLLFYVTVATRGGGLPYERLMEMCRWMGSNFHDWLDYNGVAFLIELLECCRTFSDFRGKTVLLIYSWQTKQNFYTVGENYFIQYKVDT